MTAVAYHLPQKPTGPTWGRPSGMPTQRGCLIRRQGIERRVTFTAHYATVRPVPSYVELHDLPEPLEPDEVVELVAEDGRRYRCSVLDHTPFCAIIESTDGNH